MANISVKPFHILMDSYTVSFSIKQGFVKLKIFSTAKKTKNETKPMHDFESTSIIKTKSP